MPVKFNIVERGNPQAPKKFYPSIQSSGRITTRQLAEQAAKESTVSPADIMAAIESFLSVIPTELAKGNIVELGDFGTFWLRTTSEGAATVEEVRSSQITSLLPRFNPGRLFKHVLDGVEYIRGVEPHSPRKRKHLHHSFKQRRPNIGASLIYIERCTTLSMMKAKTLTIEHLFHYNRFHVYLGSLEAPDRLASEFRLPYL